MIHTEFGSLKNTQSDIKRWEVGIKKNYLHSFTDQKASTGLSSCKIKPQDYMFLHCNRTLFGSIMQWHQKEDLACVCCVRLVQWQSSSAVLCPIKMCVCMCCCWSPLYSAILHSWGDSLHSCVCVHVCVCVCACMRMCEWTWTAAKHIIIACILSSTHLEPNICLQATSESISSQPWLHTVPHTPL